MLNVPVAKGGTGISKDIPEVLIKYAESFCFSLLCIFVYAHSCLLHIAALAFCNKEMKIMSSNETVYFVYIQEMQATGGVGIGLSSVRAQFFRRREVAGIRVSSHLRPYKTSYPAETYHAIWLSTVPAE